MQRFSVRRFASIAIIVPLAVSLAAASEKLLEGGWGILPQEEIEVQKPRIDPNAHAEFLYRELHVNDRGEESTIFRYHHRAKLFTEAGVEAWSKVDIPYLTGWKVTDIKARVIYPDGSVAHLTNRDVHRREVFKDDSFSGYARSFSFPGLRPGCIVEYKWTETRRFWVPSFFANLRAEWPTWRFSVTVNPYRGYASSIVGFNTTAAIEKNKSIYRLEVSDQPAISQKPYLAARKDFEPFVYMGYASELKALLPKDYWSYRGGALIEVNKEFLRPKQRVVKDLADELFTGLMFNEEKLQAAYAYCAEKIVNIDAYTDRYTEQEIEELKQNKSPSATIKNGYGTRYDINSVFASLAGAAGFVACLAQVENHGEYTYRPNALGSFNLSDWVVAIKQGDGWRYFDPGSSFLPFETLNPENVEANTIQTDEAFYYLAKTKAVTDDYSQASRLGQVSIDEAGDLTADVTLQYNGYSGLWRKRLYAGMTSQERLDHALDSEWKNRFPRAEIENFTLRHEDSREKPLQVRFTLRIPAFADVAGGRMVFKPSLFEQGKPLMFPDEKRSEHIAFDYKARVIDRIVYSLPPGYVVEADRTVDGTYDGAALDLRARFAKDPETQDYVYQRYYWQKATKMSAAAYPIIKAEFDGLSEMDERQAIYIKEEALALAD